MRKRRGDVIVKVDVTAEDYAHGVEADCWACPVARALKRAVGQPVHVYYSRITDGGGEWSRPLPFEAVDAQRVFDGGKVPAPFSFEVAVPSHYVRP